MKTSIFLLMNFKDKKINDFVDKLNFEMSIIIGGNGQGKTRYIKQKFLSETDDKVFFDENTPSIMKSLSSILEPYLFESQDKIDINESNIKHINKMLGKNYLDITYSVLDISETFDLSDMSQYINSLSDIVDQSLLYYNFNVSTNSNQNYNSTDMSMGERFLLSLFLEVNNKKNYTFYLDEPLNYLSTSTSYSFVKLLIYSSFTNNNKFVISTNSLELIDVLLKFNVPISICNIIDSVPTKLEIKDYLELYTERYEFALKAKKDEIIYLYVEDILIKELIESFDFPFTTKVVICNGDGNLNIISKAIQLDILPFKGICIYDGNISINKNEKSKINIPIIDIETEIINFVEEKNSDFMVKFKKKKHLLKKIVSENEKHDAFVKIKKLLNKDNSFFIEEIKKNKHVQFNDFIESIKNYFFAVL